LPVLKEEALKALLPLLAKAYLKEKTKFKLTMKRKIIWFTTALLLYNLTIQAQTKISKEDLKPKVFVVLDISVSDSIMYEQYRISVEPIIKKYGGKYLVRSGEMTFDKDPNTKVIPVEGNWNPDRFIIIEWNSIEEFQNFTSSEEYKKVAELRSKSSSTKSIIVKEYMKN